MAHGGYNYGFVEFKSHRDGETAVATMNSRAILGTEIRVNWSFTFAAPRDDMSGHFHIFVGDLGQEINDHTLSKAFAVFGSMSDARVMWDPTTGKSRGYGFIAFKDKHVRVLALNPAGSKLTMDSR